MSELRRIIRESIDQQGWKPGRWYPGSGEPVDSDEVGLMGTAGLGREDKDEGDLNEALLTVKGLKKSSFEEVQKKFPKFVDLLLRKFGDKEVKSASFAISPQGFLGIGGKVPLMVTQDYNSEVVYWEDNVIKYNGSISLADAVRNPA